MKNHLMLVTSLMWLGQLAFAGTPLWTFTPLTATSVSIGNGATATVQYTVTNQSRKSHTLVMREITGVTQETGGTKCDAVFTLAYQASCTLSLRLSGTDINSSFSGGPIVCQNGSAIQCYQPSAANALSVTKTANPTHKVSGMVSGLIGTLVLQLNGANDLSVTSGAESFLFTQQVEEGASYAVTIKTQPVSSTCQVIDGSGTMGTADIDEILISCV